MIESKWSQEYSVGDEAIDDDHKGLFQLIDMLQHADRSEIDMAEIIAELEDYAEEHFAREEIYMRDEGFPDLKHHIEEHKAFVEWLETIKKTYRRAAESPFQVGEVVNDFLVEWLRNHIMTEDMKYRDYILAKKKEPA
ncbi:hemerythrin [Rhodobium orientis]|uniref:Hemerythrin-like domain-containing protein n=1 Tax=Rhodobium orientis TaxID=34017 RepID=A0A327JSG5_9HYPH|nr:bacteriohemerythrin [Rhodobium orientis]MBB4302528.1 hemerythrin [Rhodobium orientis]MBK5949377.1 hypothetical protein [Rhodobium orientis]RAI29187.1 hypothetical protein CH339_04295 [Rhodobium orientis]